MRSEKTHCALVLRLIVHTAWRAVSGVRVELFLLDAGCAFAVGESSEVANELLEDWPRSPVSDLTLVVLYHRNYLGSCASEENLVSGIEVVASH